MGEVLVVANAFTTSRVVELRQMYLPQLYVRTVGGLVVLRPVVPNTEYFSTRAAALAAAAFDADRVNQAVMSELMGYCVEELLGGQVAPRDRPSA